MSHQIIMKTTRLFLRRFTSHDAQLLFELDGDPEVMRHISRGQPTPLAVIESKILPRWLRYYDEHPHLGFWAAHKRDNHEFLGWFHLRHDRLCPNEIELGYRLKRSAWGRGYATEGAVGLITRGFADWSMDKIVARALVGNRASIQVMQKCGMRFEQFFSYSADFLPGWSATERQAVKYAIRR